MTKPNRLPPANGQKLKMHVSHDRMILTASVWMETKQAYVLGWRMTYKLFSSIVVFSSFAYGWGYQTL